MASINSYFGGVHSNSSDKITLCPANPTFSESTCLDSFKIRGSEYARKSAFATAHHPRERRSPIWRFGENLVRMTDGADVYYCWTCECEKKQQELPVLKGNSSALKYMMSHGYDREGNKVDKSAKTMFEATALYTLVTITRYESVNASPNTLDCVLPSRSCNARERIFCRAISMPEPVDPQIVVTRTRGLAKVNNGRISVSKGDTRERTGIGSQRRPFIIRFADNAKLQGDDEHIRQLSQSIGSGNEQTLCCTRELPLIA
jgi:hypothetical protein